MILHLLENFINAKFDDLNSVLDTSVKVNLVSQDFNFEDLSLNNSMLNYQVFITSVNSADEFENPNIDILNARIDFIFLITGKDVSVYKEKFDSYVWQCRRLLKNAVVPRVSYQDTNISFGLWINDIRSVNVTNADRFDGHYYRPSIEVALRVFDETAILNLIDASKIAV